MFRIPSLRDSDETNESGCVRSLVAHIFSYGNPPTGVCERVTPSVGTTRGQTAHSKWIQQTPFDRDLIGNVCKPRNVTLIAEHTVDEADEAGNCSEEEHLGVEPQPSKVDTDLLTVVLPVEA